MQIYKKYFNNFLHSKWPPLVKTDNKLHNDNVTEEHSAESIEDCLREILNENNAATHTEGRTILNKNADSFANLGSANVNSEPSKFHKKSIRSMCFKTRVPTWSTVPCLWKSMHHSLEFGLVTSTPNLIPSDTTSPSVRRTTTSTTTTTTANGKITFFAILLKKLMGAQLPGMSIFITTV